MRLLPKVDLKRLKLKHKMLAILGLSTLVLMTATIQISAYLTKKAIGENLKPLQSMFSEIAADAVMAGLMLEDTAEINSALGEFTQQDLFSYIRVTDKNGNQVFYFRQDGYAAPEAHTLETLNKLPDEAFEEIPVTSNETLLGTLTLGLSLTEQAKSLQAVRMIFILLGLGVLVLFSGVAVVIANMVTKPIGLLVDASEQVAQGDLTATVETTSEDEIGVLATSFNSMVVSMKQATDLVQEEKARVEEAMHQAEQAAQATEAQQQYLARSVENMLTEIKKFADGDLTVHLDAERDDDEIGQLFEGFNRAVSNLRRLFEQIQQAVSSTVTSANEISRATEELAAGAQEQATQAGEVAAAVEEMARTIVENAATATHTADVAEKNGKVAQEGGQIVKQTVEKIRQIAEVVGTSSQTVERLGVSSQKIGEIVSVIDDIADQTNMLALNAAIEAARAGDHGRGFAVVADEVRKLAERTTSATKQIAEMIQTIQVETAEAVASMKQGNEEVRAGISLADKAGTSLNRIVKDTQETVSLISQIAAASEEQSKTSEDISRSVESITTVTEDSARGMTDIARSSDELNRLMNELRGLVTQFKIDHRQTDRAAVAPRDTVPADDAWSQQLAHP